MKGIYAHNKELFNDKILNITEKDINFGLNYGYIDINKGIMLKIGEN